MSPFSSLGLVRLLTVGATLVISLPLAGCVQVSNGTWMFRSADTPEDWPAATPVGEVLVQEYPSYREAMVTRATEEGDAQRSLFMSLFRHIQAEDISMTAPVDMGYTGMDGEAEPTSMAFLYPDQLTGETGANDAVQVQDVAPQAFASVGIRGSYSQKNYRKGLDLLQIWLEENAAEWQVTGDPRYLGYNSPFVLWFMRYGEVQVPVERRAITLLP